MVWDGELCWMSDFSAVQEGVNSQRTIKKKSYNLKNIRKNKYAKKQEKSKMRALFFFFFFF